MAGEMIKNFPNAPDQFPKHFDNVGEKINASDMNNVQDAITETQDYVLKNLQGVTDVEQRLDEHLTDYVKHPADGGTTGGTATAYTANSNPNPTAFVDKMGIVITAHADSGANPTLKWGTLAAKPIVKANGSPAGFKKDGIYTLRYNETKGNFQLQGEGSEERTGHVNAQSISRSGTTLRFRPQEGYYPADANNSVQFADVNFVAGNILKGKTLFGLLGSYEVPVVTPFEAGVRNDGFTLKTPPSNAGASFFISSTSPYEMRIGQTSAGNVYTNSYVESNQLYNFTDVNYVVFTIVPNRMNVDGGQGHDYFRFGVGTTSVAFNKTPFIDKIVVDVRALTGNHNIWCSVDRNPSSGLPARYAEMHVTKIEFK